MPTDDSANTNTQNRRENFRIDDLLAASVQKIESDALPIPRIIPVAVANLVRSGGGQKSFSHEIDPSFALMLLDASAKLNRLFEFYKLPKYNEEKDFKPSLSQLLLQINAKLETILDFHHIARHEEEPRVGEVSLSASGIKLAANETFVVGDFVEIHLLLSMDQPCWVVVGGSVVRVTPFPEGGCQVAAHFTPTSATIQDAITTYALKKQKEQLIGQRWLEA
ncbi:MAG: hypothetical protein A2505_09835 [Deltaproteobacteria bacterium RIFOXYD12_FULL_55_16]|nr:MAG: hypothetical protein A2505_09835 [Deltaproteobacteria bacterium RIFOXYD12_FULL_55_16]